VNNLINIGNNCIIRNNIFHSGYYSNPNNYTVSDLYNSIIENNIFINAPTVLTIYNGINCIIRNNMYSENTIWYIYCPGCTILNNLISYNIYDIFYNGFHLNPLSPGINAGTDGTDIGIYGGLYSWKDGSIPFNPHIQQKTISGTTDNNGNLNVNIKVEAQDH
jgi:Pyruvate/2-oxoacid:ferredoxin oxidoreductase delta subunit